MIDWIDAEETEGIDIKRVDIEQCVDLDQLCVWFINLIDTADIVSCQLDAFKEAGTAKEEWLHRAGGKLARCKVAMRWVDRRIISLGGKTPHPPTDPRTVEINRLLEENRKLKRRVWEMENPRETAEAA